MKQVAYKYDVATKRFEVTVALEYYQPMRHRDKDHWFVLNKRTLKITSKMKFATEQEAYAYAAELELMAARR